MRKVTAVVVVALSMACQSAPPPAPPAGPAEDLIATGPMTEHIKKLASDEFEGRAPATPGGEKTQNYLAEQLKAIGVEPGAPDGTYFQQVPIVESVVERGAAIERAVAMAAAGDVVLIAGKGHEKYQQIGDRVLPFDDGEVARAALAKRRARTSS